MPNERFMQHHYGANGFVTKITEVPKMPDKRYTHEFFNAVNKQLPESVIEAMADQGWNALGIYELVRDEIKQHRKLKLPVMTKELQERQP